MRIIFSRKGFDSTAGGAPSPIVGGKPVSLPIPSNRGSDTRYSQRGLGPLVSKVTRRRIGGRNRCHDDPLFEGGYCWFGQCGSAQGHLAKQGVTAGDVFLFFGLFAEEETGERHHRIFGHMTIEAIGSPDQIRNHSAWRETPRPHPHFSGEWPANNTIYFGAAGTASRASEKLRLTSGEGPLNVWKVPVWLRRYGLTYHGRPERWIGPGLLNSAKRGQEFVCNIGDAQEPRKWLAEILEGMKD